VHRNELTKAVAYFRTSSMTNVDDEKDTLKRQRQAVTAFAKSGGYGIIAEYSDNGVKGTKDLPDKDCGWRVVGEGVGTVRCDERDAQP
jgi:hypothetical protein